MKMYLYQIVQELVKKYLATMNLEVKSFKDKYGTSPNLNVVTTSGRKFNVNYENALYIPSKEYADFTGHNTETEVKIFIKEEGFAKLANGTIFYFSNDGSAYYILETSEPEGVRNLNNPCYEITVCYYKDPDGKYNTGYYEATYTESLHEVINIYKTAREDKNVFEINVSTNFGRIIKSYFVK